MIPLVELFSDLTVEDPKISGATMEAYLLFLLAYLQLPNMSNLSVFNANGFVPFIDYLDSKATAGAIYLTDRRTKHLVGDQPRLGAYEIEALATTVRKEFSGHEHNSTVITNPGEFLKPQYNNPLLRNLQGVVARLGTQENATYIVGSSKHIPELSVVEGIATKLRQ